EDDQELEEMTRIDLESFDRGFNDPNRGDQNEDFRHSEHLDAMSIIESIDGDQEVMNESFEYQNDYERLDEQIEQQELIEDQNNQEEEQQQEYDEDENDDEQQQQINHNQDCS